MSDLAELERRITDALDRIGAGVERMAEPAKDGGPESTELAALREALADERTANAQLEERVKTVRRKDEARIKELEDEMDDLKAAGTETAALLQQLHAANKDLKDALEARNEADPGADPVEAQSLRDELQALRQVRDADRAELDAILGSLKPLMEDQPSA